MRGGLWERTAGEGDCGRGLQERGTVGEGDCGRGLHERGTP